MKYLLIIMLCLLTGCASNSMNIDELTTPYNLATESKSQNPPKELTELLEKEGKSKTENSEKKPYAQRLLKNLPN